MHRILVIAENSFQQEKIRSILELDESVQLIKATLRQASRRSLKALQQADLIVLENTRERSASGVTERLLAALKKSELPIVLLPVEDRGQFVGGETLVLNLTEHSIAKPGLAALINRIRERSTNKTPHYPQPISQSAPAPSLLPLAKEPIPNDDYGQEELFDLEADLADSNALMISESSDADAGINLPSKMVSAIVEVGQVTKRLKEPLSNMNLAIHMLSRVRSTDERDRYVKLLKEEYYRELHLINELEDLYNSLATLL